MSPHWAIFLQGVQWCAGSATVESCSISGNTLDGLLIADGANAAVKDSLVFRNGGYGINAKDGRAVLETVSLSGNGKGDFQTSDMADVVIQSMWK